MTDVDEDQGVNDFLHDIEDSDNGYEDEAMCCRHSYKYKCTCVTFHGIYMVPAEILYHWCQLCISGPP